MSACRPSATGRTSSRADDRALTDAAPGASTNLQSCARPGGSRCVWSSLAPGLRRNHGTVRRRRVQQQSVTGDESAPRAVTQERPQMVVARIARPATLPGSRHMALAASSASTASTSASVKRCRLVNLGRNSTDRYSARSAGERRWIKDPESIASSTRVTGLLLVPEISPATTTFVSTKNTGGVIAHARHVFPRRPAPGPGRARAGYACAPWPPGNERLRGP